MMKKTLTQQVEILKRQEAALRERVETEHTNSEHHRQLYIMANEFISKQERLLNDMQKELDQEKHIGKFHARLYDEACRRADMFAQRCDRLLAEHAPQDTVRNIPAGELSEEPYPFVFRLDHVDGSAQWAVVSAVDYDSAVAKLSNFACDSITHEQDALIKQFGGVAFLTD